jgi:hypothetical protein
VDTASNHGAQLQAAAHVAHPPDREAGEEDLFDVYVPPFELVADMLFVLTSIPTERLTTHMAPRGAFLGIGGATPALVWFSRVRSIEHGPQDARRLEDESTGFGYDELTVMVATRSPRLFVPVILATDGLTQRVGHRYGMPKRRTAMRFELLGDHVRSEVADGAAYTRVDAELVSSGRLCALPFDLPAPWWSWPIDFPDGSYVRGQVRQVPRARLALVSGSFALDEPWSERPVRFAPVGAFVPSLVMRLPAPDEGRAPLPR